MVTRELIRVLVRSWEWPGFAPVLHEVRGQLLQPLPLLSLLDLFVDPASSEYDLCRCRVLVSLRLYISVGYHLHQELGVVPHEGDNALPPLVLVCLWVSCCIEHSLVVAVQLLDEADELLVVDVFRALLCLLPSQHLDLVDNEVDPVHVDQAGTQVTSFGKQKVDVHVL